MALMKFRAKHDLEDEVTRRTNGNLDTGKLHDSRVCETVRYEGPNEALGIVRVRVNFDSQAVSRMLKRASCGSSYGARGYMPSKVMGLDGCAETNRDPRR